MGESACGPAHGLPAQCWHGPACAAHAAHNCSGSGPRLSGAAAHDRAVRAARSTAACMLGGAVTSPMREGGWLCARSGGARLGWRGGRGGDAYRRGVRQGGGAAGVDGALRHSYR
jgi:hypothetical protein